MFLHGDFLWLDLDAAPRITTRGCAGNFPNSTDIASKISMNFDCAIQNSMISKIRHQPVTYIANLQQANNHILFT